MDDLNTKSTVRLKKSTVKLLDLFTALVGRKSWTRTVHHCTGKWRGTAEYGVQFDDGLYYFISCGMKYFESKLQGEINTIHRIRTNREKYLGYFRQRALQDNMTAEAEGLFPVSVIDVGLCTESSTYFLWPYLLLEVNGTRFKFIETGVCYCMKDDNMEKWVEHCKKPLFTAGAVQHPDFIFQNVRFSSKDDLHKIK